MSLGRAKDITGSRFGMLTVLAFATKSRNGTTKWLCACDCGLSKVLFVTALNRGQVSCGCLARAAASIARKTHGLTKTPTWLSWKAMRTRCANMNASDYPEYGGRGIKVCGAWKDFATFYADMGERPDGKTLDRENNDGNYEPGNCKWSTAKEQANNRRPARPGRWPVTKKGGVATVDGAISG